MKIIRARKVWRITGGGVLGVIGFVLSPLSWWNDLLVNVPLALGFAYVINSVATLLGGGGRMVFMIGMVVGYWLTNILGFVLMERGYSMIAKKKHNTKQKLSWKKHLLWNAVYTVLMIAVLWYSASDTMLAFFE